MLIPKGDFTVLGRDDSAVCDSNPVDVTCKIVQDFTSSLGSRFTVNDPVLLPYRFRQLNIFELSANIIEEDTAKQFRQGFDGNQVVIPGT